MCKIGLQQFSITSPERKKWNRSNKMRVDRGVGGKSPWEAGVSD